MKELFLCSSEKVIEQLENGSVKKFLSDSGRYIYHSFGQECVHYISLFYGDVYSWDVKNCTHETIVNSFEKNGIDFLANLDGDFSLILFDKKNEILYGAVDKFGLKSLFYYKDEAKIFISNRISTIYKLNIIEKKPNTRKNFLFVGSHYRHIDAIPEETFYGDIFRIKQHSYIKHQNNFLEIDSYWDLALIDLSKKTKEELKKEYLDLLRESVRQRLAHSRNPAFMVSSGMDSSGVAVLASEILGQKITMLTTVFGEDTEYNEANEIEPLANKIAKEWHKFVIDPTSIQEVIYEIVMESDEPFYTVTQLMHYYLSKEVARLGFDTLFGGLGGDEANCGEIEEYLFYFADLKYRGDESRLEEDIDGWIKYHGTSQYPKSYDIAHEYFEKHIDFSREGKNLLDYDRYSKYFTIFKDDFYNANFFAPELEHPYKSYLRNKLHQDLFSEAIPCVLKAEDFSLSKFDLSARMPYFNDKVMQYGFSIPIKYKYKQGCNKAILREAMCGILPDETVENCIKKGWNAPFGEWIKKFLKEKIEEIINNPTQRQIEIYKLDIINTLLDEHLSGKTNHMMFFWQFLNYEMWYGINFRP